VGCSKYPSLPDDVQLEGPANDVVLLRDLLTERFQFPRENIVILSEAEGVRDARRYPTRANIQREFETLAKKAGDRSNARVVVLLCGHGFIPPPLPEAGKKAGRPEGIEPSFAPADLAAYDQEKKGVPNAILASELREWTARIVKNGATMWFIADCCYSGDLTRGTETPRKLSPEDLKLLKADGGPGWTAPGELLGQRSGRRPAPFQMKDSTGRITVIYAAHVGELTVERPMPMRPATGKVYGLLTYTLCEMLSQAKSPPTYQELVRKVSRQYDSMDRSFPTPVPEGVRLDRKVLGYERFPASQAFTLRKSGQRWAVHAGSLHGLTEGSVLACYKAGGEKPSGHVRVTDCDPQRATVTPYAYGGKPEPPALTAGWRCEPVYIDYGDFRLRLAAEVVEGLHAPPGNAGRQASLREKYPTEYQQLIERLRRAAEKQGTLQVVEEPGQADLLVRVHARTGEVWLLPGVGMGPEQSNLGEDGFGPYSPKDWDGRLPVNLLHIARVKSLLALTQSREGIVKEAPVRINVRLFKHRDREDKEGAVLDPASGGIELAGGELVSFRVVNHSADKVHVTLLHINSDYGIFVLYPRGDGVPEPLPPGQSMATSLIQVTSRTTGREKVVALAVRASNTGVVDFTSLARPISTRPGEIAELEASALGRLLRRAIYGEGNERGLSLKEMGEHSFEMLSFTVLPGVGQYTQQGIKLARRGEVQKARAMFEQALALSKKDVSNDILEVARIHIELGEVLTDLRDLPAARQHYEQALAILRKALRPDHPAIAHSLHNLGNVLYTLGELAAARQHYYEALAIRRKALPTYHPDIAVSLNNLGLVLYDLGELEAARQHYEEALAIRRKTLPKDHPTIANSLTGLGNVLRALGELAAARQHYEEALAIDRRALPKGHPDVAVSLNNLGNVLADLRELPAARQCYEEALAIDRKALPRDHPDIAVSLNNLGRLYQVQEDYGQALRFYQEALAITGRALGKDHPAYASCLSNLGALYGAQKKYEEALILYEQALRIRKVVLGANHPDTLGLEKIVRELKEADVLVSNPADLRHVIRAKLAEPIKKLLEKERQEAIYVSDFIDPDHREANAGPGIQQLLAEELKSLKVSLSRSAKVAVRGRYQGVYGKADPGGLRLVLTAEVTDSLGQRRAEFKATIRGEAEIARLLGVTASVPDLGEFGDPRKREEEIVRRLEKPSVHIQDSKVSAREASPYAVEVLRMPAAGAAAEAVRAKEKDGQAFVDINKDDRFQIRIHNRTDKEAAVSLSIDGLDSFAFSDAREPRTGAPKFRHYIIPPRSAVTVAGWNLHVGAAQAYAAFQVTEYVSAVVSGAVATPYGKPGVITVTFAEARQGAPRSVGETTGLGPVISRTWESVQRTIRPVREVVSVRFTR
jgi:tetratricopeptide (TPR) repeat protein